MKAMVLKEFNTDFQLEDIAIPEISEGKVLVKVVSSGINPLDIKIKSGQAAHAEIKMPNAVLGLDMSGIVISVGAGVTGFAVGDAVYGMVGGVGDNQGTMAEFVVADALLLAKMPEKLSFKQAAALPLISITAWEALVDRANVKPGDKVLIHGGAGGVGHIAIQIAKSKGAVVFTTVTPEEIPLVESFGAVAIDRTIHSVGSFISERSETEGFDIILDTVGGKVLDDSFQYVKRYTGRVVSILGWGSHSLAPLSFRGATYSGVFTLYPLLSGEHRQHHGEILEEIAKLANEGLIVPIVDNRDFCFIYADEAYAILSRGEANGKMVLDVFREIKAR
ncbi:quinone oxidoreductase [Flavobacterium akiainvivens]|uniref:Quinone oxidoreductase n=1 Tax=Flavobacterium akiainvivens TaxID=1202724 RepID=A0A0M8MGK0_9FLAO|nr:zinc-dependent alcohol dehydrogenase family protein [Flavobacterium akiainvivens]KOS05138.1 quinone oxidoreductase [Flavobacterium akiainvivens]SFQ51255.1 NADPH:quinone reductase [Flavobacterium akiainvivens]